MSSLESRASGHDIANISKILSFKFSSDDNGACVWNIIGAVQEYTQVPLLSHMILSFFYCPLLKNEKAKVEQSLQEELERKLEEKDKDLQAGLEKEKAKLEEVIANKEREYAELQTEVHVYLIFFLSSELYNLY